MKQEFTVELVAAFNEKIKGTPLQCPICHKHEMTIMPGLFINVIHEDNIDILRFGPNAVPTIPLICRNCGFISQHAVTALIPNWEDFKKRYEQQSAEGN